MKITTPGVYDVPIEAYHNMELCPAPSISGSGLVTMAPPEPVARKFWWNSTMNPKRTRVDTEALRIGKCAHTLYLEGIDAVQAEFVIDSLPRTGEGSGNAMKAFRAQAKADGKIVIKESDWSEIQAMIKAATGEYPLIRAAFSDGVAERTLVVQDDETGVWLRCRPDWLPTDLTHLAQYKTARSASQSGFSHSIHDYGYHIKAAHEIACIRALALGDPKTYTHYVQEKDAPYLMAIHTVPRETLEYGEVQRRAAIRYFARCLDRDEWPGYPTAAQETGLPVYALRQLQAADLSGMTQQEQINEPTRPREEYLTAG